MTVTALNPAFSFYVDWNRDNDFSDANEDITPYVMSARWGLGNKQPFQDVADESTLNLVLRNTDRRFSPEYSGSPLAGTILPQRGVLVQSTMGSLTTTHWRGWIDHLTPAMGQYSGPFTVMARCIGARQFLQAAEINLQLLENATADEVIAAIFGQVQFPPALDRAWLLGVPGASELGVTTYLADDTTALDLEVGDSVFPYVGDNWDRITNGWAGIKSAVSAERGKFFFTRGGVATFWNRSHLQTTTTLDATVTNTMQGMDYAYGDDVVNDARVNFYPRALSADNTATLWTMDKAITIKPGQEKTIRARYTSAEGERVGGRNVQTPTAGAGTLAFSAGTATLVTFTPEDRSATLVFRNGSTTADAIISTLVIKGQKITSWNSEQTQVVNAASIAVYGRKTWTLDAKLLEDDVFARNVADYEVARRKDPRGRARSLTMTHNSDANVLQMVKRTIGDRVAIEEAQTAHEAEYFIVGEEWTWGKKGKDYSVRWTLEPCPAYNAWLLGTAGRSELGETTYLGL